MQNVTALMITGKTPNHRKLAELAVEAFHAQSYEDRQLVAINTSDTAPWFPAHPQVTEVSIEQGDKTLGELRNLSYDVAVQGTTRPELLIQWDDDDYHHPERIAWQVSHHVPGTCSILFRQYRLNLFGSWGVADGSRWQYGGIVGTMLHGINDYRYPAMVKGEDTAYLQNYKRRSLVNPQDNPAHLYVRIYHGENTWGRKRVMRPALVNGNKFKGDGDYIEGIRERYLRRLCSV